MADFARVISQYVDALAVRTFSQTTIEELARHATIPIINALSDWSHPCQALADLLTVREALGELAGLKIAFVGDGNNVARSLAQASALFGVDFVLACPAGYEYPTGTFAARFAQAYPGVPLAIEHDPRVAVGAGRRRGLHRRLGEHGPGVRDRGPQGRSSTPTGSTPPCSPWPEPTAIFLHCLPAHRGEEVTDEVLEGPSSLVFPQAANRLHFQKALLAWLV